MLHHIIRYNILYIILHYYYIIYTHIYIIYIYIYVHIQCTIVVRYTITLYYLIQDQGYRARSAFKLIQLAKKQDFLSQAPLELVVI